MRITWSKMELIKSQQLDLVPRYHIDDPVQITSTGRTGRVVSPKLLSTNEYWISLDPIGSEIRSEIIGVHATDLVRSYIV